MGKTVSVLVAVLLILGVGLGAIILRSQRKDVIQDKIYDFVLPDQYEGYKSCNSDSECVRVRANTCDECNCGTYINKNFKDKYLSEIGDNCKSFGGPTCSVLCLATSPRCIENRCVGVFDEWKDK